MSGFASSVLLGDLNDFIGPSQACVNPIFSDSANAGAKKDGNEDPGGPKLAISFESDMNTKMEVESTYVAPDLIKSTERKTAKVSLSDCLACSGCVTSAETVLIQQQSVSEFELAASSGKYDVVVVTISGQSRASLAAHFGCEPIAMERRVLKFLQENKSVDYVLDAGVAGDIALLETANEFCHRYRNRAAENQWVVPTYSRAMNDKETQVNPDTANAETITHDGAVEPGTNLPMLSSVCPGWICLAEKSHPEAIPYISTAKSPQQVAGALVKTYISKLTNVPREKIYHATIMPCADKKLEGSRKDFFDKETSTMDVDCVLTTHEVAEMLENHTTDDKMIDVNMKERNEQVIAACAELSNASKQGESLLGAVTSMGGSGGYIDYIFRFAAKELFNVNVPPGPLPFKQGRNSDMYTLELHREGKPVLKFAAAYGFRNIQSIVRQMKRGKCSYDFVEIMACPGGCLNGGGQVRPAKVESDVKLTDAAIRKERLEVVSNLFHQVIPRSPSDNAAVAKIYQEFVGGNPFSDNARKLFHTRYHAVPKLENGLLEKW